MLLSKSLSAQIVGGELFLTKIDRPGVNYRLGLTNYFNGALIKRGTNYSNYYLRIYRKRDKVLVARLEVIKQPDVELAHSNKACEDNLGIDYYGIPYFKDYYLDPEDYSDPEGYFIKLDECCRQYDISNVQNAHLTSIVYYAEFPSLKNNPEFSSPLFTLPTFQVYCINQTFTSNFGALAPTGYTYKYSLVDPLQGFTTFNSPTNPRSTSLDFVSVNWVGAYKADKVLNGSPTLQIDSKTGIITGHPVETGNFIFAIKCEIYDGSEIVGLFRRDFVISIINCEENPPTKPIISANSIIDSGKAILCSGEILTLEADFSPGYNYRWVKDEKSISDSNTISIKETGTYKVYTTYKNSCVKSISSDSIIVISAFDVTTPKIKFSSAIGCPGDTITLTIDNLLGEVSWFRDGNFYSDKSTIQITQKGTYRSSWIALGSCPNNTISDSIILSFITPPVSTPIKTSFSYCPSDDLELKTEYNKDYSYNWFKSGTETTLSIKNTFAPKDTGNYLVSIDYLGCESTSEIYQVNFGPECGGVAGNGLYFPQAFSPNGDGINDVYEILNLNQGDNDPFRLRIFNRWGIVVFESTTPKSWDGFYKGKSLPIGYYNYILEYATQTKKGRIFLIY